MVRLRWITISLVLVIAAVCVLAGITLLEMRREMWRHDVQGAGNLMVAGADDFLRTVSIYDLSLQATGRLLDDPAIRGQTPHLQQASLFDQAMKAPYLGPIRVIDASGTVTHDSFSLSPSPPSAIERSELDRHRGSPDRGLFISRPFELAQGRFQTLAVSRRLDTPDGRFAGIIAGTIQLSYFSDLFRRLSLGPHEVVSLFREDGVLLAHAPDTAHVGDSIAGSEVMRRFGLHRSGRFVARSALDHRRRVYSFIHLDGLPLVLDVGLSVRDIYASWWQKARLVCGGLLAMTLTGLALLFGLRRELRRRLALERQAKADEARYRLLADNVSDLILRLDSRLVRTYVSPACRAYGYEPAELLDMTPQGWVHPDDWAQVQSGIARARQQRTDVEIVYRIRASDGSHPWVESRYSFVPSDGGFIAVLRNITQRKQAEALLEQAVAELARQATLDGLTGLANRRRFDEVLSQEWRRARRDTLAIALLVIDADHFKSFNDQYGHHAGDRFIRQVADAARDNIRRPGDLVARYGGEEFVAILPNTDLFGAIEVAEAVRQAVLDLRLPHDGNPLGHASISIGVACALPQPGDEDPMALFTFADDALYAAKRAGRNQVKAGQMRRIAVP